MLVVCIGYDNSLDEQVQDGSREWVNLTLFLASFAGCGTFVSTHENDSPSLNAFVTRSLPVRLQNILRTHSDDATQHYLRQMTDFLTVDSVQLRELAKEALGNELCPRMFPHVLSLLDL